MCDYSHVYQAQVIFLLFTLSQYLKFCKSAINISLIDWVCEAYELSLFMSWCFSSRNGITLRRWGAKLTQALRTYVRIRNVSGSFLVNLFFISDVLALCNLFIVWNYETPTDNHFLSICVCFFYFNVAIFLMAFIFSCQDCLNLMERVR